MASVSDEENINQEETVRRTRSGRKAAPVTTPTVRSTRRSSRKQTQEQTNEAEAVQEEENIASIEEEMKYQQSEIIQEMLAEAAQGVLVDNPTEVEIGMETVVEETAIQENEISESITQIADDSEMIAQIVESEEQVTPPEDDKSSSFPFGNVIPSENSDGGKTETEEHVVTNMADCVDSSLLASLAGDNANSLPSAGEESLSKENFEVVESSVNDLVNDEIKTTPEPTETEIVTEITTEEIPVEMTEIPTQITTENEDSESEHAIREDLQNGENESDKTIPDIDAEMVSEDELPMRNNQPKVTDAEEVSDDELPAPVRAELPADTEVVSEDEFPSAKKRKADEGYDPGSPTSESTEVPEKKTKLEVEASEKEEVKEKKKEKKKLPELDKYWKAVNDDPSDFTGWTYLLQYVDQENDIDAAREAYDAFLSHYPYCYGYWRKYADYEKRKGNKKKCEEVFERGLKAIPLSVDLWIHYLTHVKANFVDDEDFIRTQFERGLSACGLEFRSDKLWEAFIRWETESKRYSYVIKIYDRLLSTPTQGYNNHFDSFQDLINNHAIDVTTIISPEELKKIRSEIRDVDKEKDKDKEKEKEKDKEKDKTKESPTKKEDEPEKTAAEESEEQQTRIDEELTAIRERIISVRRKLHKQTVSAVTARWIYEEGIKRPYFHVKPLERCQLKNWKEYIDFEIEQGDRKRVLVLFERCLIACALYDDFWLKLIRYLESQNDPELVPNHRDAFERACTIHHTDKPSLHLMWAAFEEGQNNFGKAAEILADIEKTCPNLLQIAYRRINLERRRGDFEQCKTLYEHYISTAKNKNIAGTLSIKYARFHHKIRGDLDEGFKVLKLALEKDPSNTRVALQMIDLVLQREKVDEEEVVQIMDKFMARENIEPEQKVLFAQRKVEFLEDFGSTSKGLQDAQRLLQTALSKASDAKKKSESSPNKKTVSKEIVTPSAASNNSALSTYNNSNYGYGTTGGSTNYYGSSQQPQQSYQSYDGYGYNHWHQYGSTQGYSGYGGQWSGYGNYY